jgi:hypothetical protein
MNSLKTSATVSLLLSPFTLAYFLINVISINVISILIALFQGAISPTKRTKYKTTLIALFQEAISPIKRTRSKTTIVPKDVKPGMMADAFEKAKSKNYLKTFISAFLFILLSPLILLLIPLLILPNLLVRVIDLSIEAYYVPTNHATVRTMIDFARVKPGMKAVDIGSGDGRLVIALAKAGAEAHGYEIHPFLVWLSKLKIRKAGLTGKAFIHQKDFWLEDLSKFDIVTVFLPTSISERLEAKLSSELKTDARIISSGPISPTWIPSEEKGKVHLYEKKV